MSLNRLELQIVRIYELIRIGTNPKTIRIYCIRLVALMEKRNALAAVTVSA